MRNWVKSHLIHVKIIPCRKIIIFKFNLVKRTKWTYEDSAIKFPNFNLKCPSILFKQKLISSELRNFVFNLVLPLLYNKLDKDHWCLLCLYVFVIKILYVPVNNKSKTVEAVLILELYHNLLENNYGKFAYTLLKRFMRICTWVIKFCNQVFFFEIKDKFKREH